MNKESFSTRRQLRRTLRKARKQRIKGLHGHLKHMMSNFRLSLTFRIALHYSWQLLRTTLLVMLIITLVCCGLLMIDVDNTVRRIKAADPQEDATFAPGKIQNAAITRAEMLPNQYKDSDLPLLAFCITDIGEEGLANISSHLPETYPDVPFVSAKSPP